MEQQRPQRRGMADSGSTRTLDLLVMAKRHLWWISALVALIVVVSSIGGSSSNEVTVSQSMLLQDVDYHELPGVHSFQESWLTEQNSTDDVRYSLPDGRNSTTFAVEGTAGSRSVAAAQVAEAVQQLSGPSPAKAFGTASASQLSAELDTAQLRLDDVTARLEAAQAEHRRLSASASATPAAIDQASQESWALAAERDLWIRRTSEVEIDLQDADFDLPFLASAVGAQTDGERGGVNIRQLLGLTGAVVLGATALAGAVGFDLTRAKVRGRRHLAAIAPTTPIVDLAGSRHGTNAVDGIAVADATKIRRLVEASDGEVVLLQVPMNSPQWLEPALQRRLARLTNTVPLKRSGRGDVEAAKAGQVVALAHAGATGAAEIRRDLARLAELDVDVVAWALVPAAVSAVAKDTEHQATDFDAVPAEVA